MASIRGFILASLTTLSSFGAAVVHAIEVATDYGGAIRQMLFDPALDTFTVVLAWVLHKTAWTWKPDAHAALALDRLGHHVGDGPHEMTMAQRFKAFIERARTHLQFDGQEFLHGRPNHLMC